LQLEISTGAFVGIHEYHQLANGDPGSQVGFLEQLAVAYQWGPLKLEVLGLVVQDWNGRWRNVYSTFERLSWQIARPLSIGVIHQLLRSQVNEASGDFQPIGFFDGRKSRIAGFVQWQL
jgi:hypothetical protein